MFPLQEEGRAGDACLSGGRTRERHKRSWSPLPPRHPPGSRDFCSGKGLVQSGIQRHSHMYSFPALRNFFFFLIFKKNHSQNKTLTAKSKMAALTPFIKTGESLPQGAEPGLHLPGILGPLAVMASSTALSCFSSPPAVTVCWPSLTWCLACGGAGVRGFARHVGDLCWSSWTGASGRFLQGWGGHQRGLLFENLLPGAWVLGAGCTC